MTAKTFFTTGEAARLLNISRCTVQRRFDQGMLLGKKNAVTGERMISRESILNFMSQHNLPMDALALEKKKVLLGTPDDSLSSLLRRVVSGDERVEIKRVSFGGDVLLSCSSDRPDLVVIDEDLSDIPCAEVVKSLRRTEDLRDLRTLCCSGGETSTRCLECGAVEALLKSDMDQGRLARKLYSLLNLPQESPVEEQTYGHTRRWRRTPLHLPAKMKVYPLRVPNLRDLGEALLEDISCGGAYVSDIRLEKGVIPGEPFRILLEVDSEPLKNWKAHCKMVRLEFNGSLAAGLEFTRISQRNLKMIKEIFQSQGPMVQSGIEMGKEMTGRDIKE